MSKREFEWDPRKASVNVGKHGIAFEQALTVFDDPFALIALDEKHSTPQEKREWIIGEADPGVLVVVFTLRSKSSVVRIISARKASKRERALYEINKGVPI